MSRFHISLVQSNLAWEAPETNRDRLARDVIDAGDTDLVILPEMFTTGFSMNAEALAEPVEGPTLSWMRTLASERQVALCGSVITRDNDKCFNRFLFVEPDGGVTRYDKKHLFRMSTENEHYAAGADRLVIEYGGLRLFPQVCYDLRFPVFSRNNLGYQLLVYVANWPAARQAHWETLLRARAIENQCYVAGVNRVGVDGNDVAYAGDSAVVDFNGQPLALAGDGECVIGAELDLDALADYRSRFPAWKDADAFTLEPDLEPDPAPDR